jgi:hypothetical protein
VPLAGVPENVAEPLLLLTKVTPAGSAPLSVIDMLAPFGRPVVVTLKFPAVPTAKVVEFALVRAGGTKKEERTDSVTLSEPL